MQDDITRPEPFPASDGNPMMTVGEAAHKLGVSIRTVQRYCKQGLLNHKWIRGKRHRELRIIPPIPITLLPGVKRGSAVEAEGLVSKEDFELLAAGFRSELARMKARIEAFEIELSRLAVGEQTVASPLSGFGEKTGALIDDFERVRPVEKKLILALARSVKEQGAFLKRLGMDRDGFPEDE
jgi:hypothetical protein